MNLSYSCYVEGVDYSRNIPNAKYQQLREKFKDKGMLQEFHWLVLPPPPYDPSRLMGTPEDNFECYLKAVEECYYEEWDNWSIWIDFQKHK